MKVLRGKLADQLVRYEESPPPSLHINIPQTDYIYTKNFNFLKVSLG